MKYILVNPLANNSKSEEVLDHVLDLIQGEADVLKLTQINLHNFVSKLNKEDGYIRNHRCTRSICNHIRTHLSRLQSAQ